MRTIELEDLNRAILTALGHTICDDPWQDDGSPEDAYVTSGLKLLVDEKTTNAIVSRFIGGLSYRSRERIVRLLARLTAWSDESVDRLNLLDYWAGHIAEKNLEHREAFYVRAPRFEAWRRQMHGLDEDLPAMAWLVVNRGDDIQTRFDLGQHLELWPTFLRGDDPQLYREVERGVACLHLHLSGAYPAPFFWVGLMNHRFDTPNFCKEMSLRGYHSEEELRRIEEWIELARAIRCSLFHFVLDIGDLENAGSDPARFKCLETKPDPEFVRDVVTKRGNHTDVIHGTAQSVESAVSRSLLGERWMMYVVMRAIRKSADKFHGHLLARLFWTYVVAKNSLLSLVQQSEGVAGFDYFVHTFGMIRWKQQRERESCCREIGRFLQESRAVLKLELMVAPQEDQEGYQSVVHDADVIRDEMNKCLSNDLRQAYGDVRVGLIVHFIKGDGESISERTRGAAMLVYHYQRRDDNLKEFEVLADCLQATGGQWKVPLIGIDAAHRELYCPPEVFSELYERAFRRLRRVRVAGQRAPIGRTYHVGEDFVNLMTGLRRIYEAVSFLGLRPGDRLGHAVALGTDPGRWIHSNPSAETHLIDVLDDAVFEWHLLRSKGGQGEGDVHVRLDQLEHTIEECAIDIFGDVVSAGVLERAWMSRGTLRKARGVDYGDERSIPAWISEQGQHVDFLGRKVKWEGGSHSAVPNLRGLAKDRDQESKLKLPKNTSERVLQEYLYDRTTIRRFLRPRSVNMTRNEPHLARVQGIIRRLLEDQGITIESNPSSNWLIGGFERHADVPAVQWTLHHPDVAMTINPDDPTVFATSIENEYFFVHAALVHGARKPISRAASLERIAKARRLGLDASFLD